MKLLRPIAAVVAFAILTVTLCSAQSLGDVARQEKSRKASAPAAKKPAVTNDDLAPAAEPSTNPPDASAEKKPPPSTHTATSRNATAAEFKVKIKEQKRRVDILEVQIKDLRKAMDRWKTSDCTHVYHPGDPYGNACDVPQKLTVEYDRVKALLDKSRAALEALQDNARRAGFGVQVYDPE